MFFFPKSPELEMVNSEGITVQCEEIKRYEVVEALMENAQAIVGSITNDSHTMTGIEGIEETENIEEISSLIDGKEGGLKYYVLGEDELAILSSNSRLLFIDTRTGVLENEITRILLCRTEGSEISSKRHPLLSLTSPVYNSSGRLLIQKWVRNDSLEMDIESINGFVYHNLLIRNKNSKLV